MCWPCCPSPSPVLPFQTAESRVYEDLELQKVDELPQRRQIVQIDPIEQTAPPCESVSKPPNSPIFGTLPPIVQMDPIKQTASLCESDCKPPNSTIFGTLAPPVPPVKLPHLYDRAALIAMGLSDLKIEKYLKLEPTYRPFQTEEERLSAWETYQKDWVQNCLIHKPIKLN